MVMQGGCVKELPMPGGIIHCDCPCHKTIEDGGGATGDCIHCRILGGGFQLPEPEDD